MATGYQDFRRGIDIAQQSLSIIEQRPKLGTLNIEKNVITVNPGEEVTVVSLAGKGNIFGISLEVSGGSDLKGDNTKSIVDANSSSNPTWQEMFEMGAMNSGYYNWILTKYNIKDGKFGLIRSNQIPFETSYQEKYNNITAGTIATVTIFVAFAKV